MANEANPHFDKAIIKIQMKNTIPFLIPACSMTLYQQNAIDFFKHFNYRLFNNHRHFMPALFRRRQISSSLFLHGFQCLFSQVLF